MCPSFVFSHHQEHFNKNILTAVYTFQPIAQHIFPCTICGRRFKWKDYVKSHMPTCLVRNGNPAKVRWDDANKNAAIIGGRTQQQHEELQRGPGPRSGEWERNPIKSQRWRVVRPRIWEFFGIFWDIFGFLWDFFGISLSFLWMFYGDECQDHGTFH